MKDMLKYKGYLGSIHFAEDDLIFYGKVEFIKALISYEGESAADIKKAFEEAIDDYLAMCEQENINPEKPFKGTFNVRVGESLHERATFAAVGRGIKLNEFVKLAIEHELKAS
ncbi:MULTISPECIES: type II toxin-antitoxin system HicB family antitoxin [Legionella]|uniref:type II toxin-antitoxin system HicB family antitoxin n=1 Tax=Legionella TaxID=445 RepID=UPI000F8D8378|nr:MULTISPECIES: type II toxin-antitoxin system HicB family antitoxin [Legionella]MCP0914979.1 type II toxin-antitoxin system HicB family antitoxin [Legionella sp. 27cVA30]RUQ92764.1 type II toxin-antitoxin system HicB family antitoxin [Legionella septentrionalis]RUR10006.1 type II toxin-antitoxin system HicB family antitoxin [Legionella septentrionalis]